MKTLTCINCPLGCQITVTTDAQGENHFDGYGCKRGLTYAQAELTHPTRTITSTVRLLGAPVGQLPVKTDAPIPKGKIRECMCSLKPVEINAPVCTGDIIVRDVCGTGVNIVATRSIPEK